MFSKCLPPKFSISLPLPSCHPLFFTTLIKIPPAQSFTSLHFGFTVLSYSQFSLAVPAIFLSFSASVPLWPRTASPPWCWQKKRLFHWLIFHPSLLFSDSSTTKMIWDSVPGVKFIPFTGLWLCFIWKCSGPGTEPEVILEFCSLTVTIWNSSVLIA